MAKRLMFGFVLWLGAMSISLASSSGLKTLKEDTQTVKKTVKTVMKTITTSKPSLMQAKLHSEKKITDSRNPMGIIF